MSNKKPVIVSRKRESKSKLRRDRVRFECSECNKKFKTNVRLQTHLLTCLKNDTVCNENSREVCCESDQRRESLGSEYERANYHRCCNRWYREITGESSDGVSETDRNQTIYERLCEEWSREMDIEQCMIIKRKEMCKRMPK